MRTFSRVTLNGSSARWFWFWAVVLLVLPNCTLDRSGIVTPTNVDRGVPPRNNAIFCDIERPAGRRCATTAADTEGTIRLNEAAVALVAGRTSMTGLDDSPAALARCGGQPELVDFQGAFPAGSNVCLNCAVIGPSPAPHASNSAVCTAQCLDLFDLDDGNVPPSAEAIAFCTAERARLSTNFPVTGCFDDACSMTGTLNAGFDDPRRHPETVMWDHLIGVTASGGSLVRTAPETGQFDATASSAASQLIAGGDAYVEFTATETDRARLAGLSSGPAPAGGVTVPDVGFGVLLEIGQLHVFENNAVAQSFPAYAVGDRFRVKLRDNFDGTASVTYARLMGPCVDGSPCSEAIFHTSANLATYPVRVDALFRTGGATLTNARIVRIH